MTGFDIQSLVFETIRSPSTAAARILQINLPKEWLWMALALMSVLNAMVYSVSLQLAPPLDPADGIFLPPVLRSPVLLTLFLFAALGLTVVMLHKLGRAMNGAASLYDVLILITWLQVLRLALQLVMLVLSLFIPAFGALLGLVATVWGVYILATFVNVAHRYDNTMKSAGVMVLSFLAIAVGMSVLMGLLGGFNMGEIANV